MRYKSQWIITSIWLNNTQQIDRHPCIYNERQVVLYDQWGTPGESLGGPRKSSDRHFIALQWPQKSQTSTLWRPITRNETSLWLGSITAGITFKIYSLLKDKENNKTKFSLISYINTILRFMLSIESDFNYQYLI